MAVTALVIGSVASAGASLYAGSKSAKASKSAAAAQAKNAKAGYDLNLEYLNFLKGEAAAFAENSAELLEDSKRVAEEGYTRIGSVIDAIPTIEELYPRGEALSRKDFDFRTGIVRENLDFILGGTSDDLREIQEFSSSLANLEPEAFTNKFSKIIDASLLNLKAETIGEPTGTFANLSAQNLYNFSNQALSNYLAVNDFIAKEGTVDPISPISTTFDLFNVEASIADRRIGNEQFRTSNLIGINNAGLGVAAQQYQNAQGIAQLGMNIGSEYYGQLTESAGASALASAQQANSVAQSIGMLTQGLTQAYGLGMQRTAYTDQRAYQQGILSNLSAQSLSNYAPRSISARPASLPSTSSFNNAGYYPPALTNTNSQPVLPSDYLREPLTGTSYNPLLPPPY